MRLDHADPAMIAEAKTLLAALQHTWSRGFTFVCFEGVCQNLVNIIHGIQSVLEAKVQTIFFCLYKEGLQYSCPLISETWLS